MAFSFLPGSDMDISIDNWAIPDRKPGTDCRSYYKPSLDEH